MSVVFCPVCKAELPQDSQSCFVCGSDPNKESETIEEWLVLGTIEDKIHADLAKETMKSCNIPAVIFSKSGFFGNVGLFLNPIHSNKSSAFEIQVPKDFLDEAADVLDSTLGEKWQRKGQE